MKLTSGPEKTMERLRKLFVRPEKLQEQARPNGLATSSLNDLPVEIFLHIADYLPPVSAISFSLTCLHLKQILDPQLPKIMCKKGKVAVLNLVARDLPNHVVCSSCGRLHDMANIQRYTLATYRYNSKIHRYDSLRYPQCVASNSFPTVGIITQSFGIIAFQMAMKRYQQDPQCMDLLNIMSKDTSKPYNYSKHYIRQDREECRIIQGSLMHRLQSVYISCESLTNTSFEMNFQFECICPHIRFSTELKPRRERCQICHTEYRLDFKSYDGHGMVMFYTRWKDLGCSPDSETWKRHFRLGVGEALVEAIRAQDARRDPTKQQPLSGELSSAFGDGDDFELYSMLDPKNMTTLFKHQRKCVRRQRRTYFTNQK